jgi:transposase
MVYLADSTHPQFNPVMGYGWIKIRILYLPPYSSNLNPIERLWKFMKKKMIANKYYEEFFDFKMEVMEFFR